MTPDPDAAAVESAADRLREEFRCVEPSVTTFGLVAVGYGALVRVVARYAAEYLHLLGASGPVVGLYGSALLAVGVAYRRLDVDPTDWDADLPPLAVLAAISAFGLLLWLVAPQLHVPGGTPLVPAWAWVVVGGGFLALWDTHGRPGTHRAVAAALDDRPSLARLAGGLDPAATLAALAVAAVPLGLLSLFLPGFLVVLALAVTAGLALAVVVAAGDGATPDGALDGDGAAGSGPGRSGVAGTTAAAVGDSNREPTADVNDPSGLRAAASRVAAASRDLHSLLLADLLSRVALGMTYTFLALVVVETLAPTARPLGVQVHPAGVFAVLVGVETVAAAVGRRVGRPLVERVGATRVMVASVGLVAAFPMALVDTPATLGVDALLFGLFGLRTVGGAARDRLLAGYDAATGRAYRTALRVGVVPSALLGGLLFTLGPRVSFRLATVVGLLGLWELLRARRSDAARAFAARLYDRLT